MLEQILVDRLTMLFQSVNCSFQINGVPQNYCCNHQIEPTSTIALVLEAAVAHFAQPIEEHRSGQGILGLASAVWVSVLHAAQQPFRSFGELADDVRRRLDLLHGTHRLPGVVGHGLDLAGAPAGRRRRHEARQG